MNTLIANVKGKNIENFIYKLHKNKIEIIKINYINRNEIEIEIFKHDIDRVLDLKGIYDVEVVKYKGITRILNILKYQKFFIIAIIIGLIIFKILTNIIYDVEIVYSGTEIRNMVSSELKNHGIVKYSFALNFDELEKIKNDILETRKDELEWLMIERVGTKYIVRLEPRRMNKIEEDDKIYSISASRDAIIKKIEASSGEVVKNVNDYVRKGDIIISSDIMLYDNLKTKVKAKGLVYGEVWYKVNIEYPLNYYEEKETGNYKTIYNIKFLNRYIGFRGFKNKKVEDSYILSSDILPLALNKQKQKEIEIISYQMGYKEALAKAHEEARKKIEANLSKDEYITFEKDLKYELKDSKIVVDIFYTVYEDITDYIETGD